MEKAKRDGFKIEEGAACVRGWSVGGLYEMFGINWRGFF